jgi:uncharacterized lipoprotein YddW (UPF0748 family)
VGPSGAGTELRAVWLATVANIDWPQGSGAVWLRSAMEALARAGCNALFLQVRPCADAVHTSGLEPPSAFVARLSGWDPLADAVAHGADLGLAVHAWINPFRCRHASHPPGPGPDDAARAAGLKTFATLEAVWLDPGDPAVRNRLTEVVTDLCLRYEVAGIHMDDYFYPYPDGTEWDYEETWRAHGGGLDRAAWRRKNVDLAVASVSAAVRSIRPESLVSVSPFGVWRPSHPPGVVAEVDSVADLCADPLAWARAGQVDLLVPQLYWPLDSVSQPFERLAEWWVAESNVPVAAGCLLGKHPVDSTLAQLRAARRAGCVGASLFSARVLLDPSTGVAEALRATSWATGP